MTGDRRRRGTGNREAVTFCFAVRYLGKQRIQVRGSGLFSPGLRLNPAQAANAAPTRRVADADAGKRCPMRRLSLTSRRALSRASKADPRLLSSAVIDDYISNGTPRVPRRARFRALAVPLAIQWSIVPYQLNSRQGVQKRGINHPSASLRGGSDTKFTRRGGAQRLQGWGKTRCRPLIFFLFPWRLSPLGAPKHGLRRPARLLRRSSAGCEGWKAGAFVVVPFQPSL
jgi:hypothetical protein